MDDQLYGRAHALADQFNRECGHRLLQVVERPSERIEIHELRDLAAREPGDYLAASIFRALRNRKPTHAEAIKLGQLLGALTIARKKDGPYTLWRLDKAFAERAH